MEPAEALRAWHPDVEATGVDGWGEVRPAPDAGLINRTWLVGTPPRAVLQWVNPIFDPRIHLDIRAVTERLAARGLETPRLLLTRHGASWIDDDAPEGGCWRLLSYVPGSTLHRLRSPRQAAAAGDLVGRFHAALAGWDYRFQAPPRHIHDTPARMAELEDALETCDDHPLAAPARDVGRAVLDAWARFDGRLELPERPCHGDLKISNLRFDEAGAEGRALVDLDTLGPLPLPVEMGDAWRSWCNPAGEEAPEACRFDVERFAASAEAWLARVGELTAEELEALVPSIERICLELAARFGADVVRNVYFREDRERYPRPGEHNLAKARCQLRLAASARDVRSTCEARLRRARP